MDITKTAVQGILGQMTSSWPRSRSEVWLWARAYRDSRGDVYAAVRYGETPDWSVQASPWIGPPVRVHVDEDKR